MILKKDELKKDFNNSYMFSLKNINSDYYSKLTISSQNYNQNHPKQSVINETNQKQIKNNSSFVNKIFINDCRNMKQLPDNSIDLMITSPPYNTTKQYDQNLTLKQYLSFIKDVMTEVYRVLKPDGIIAFNIANVGRKPYIPLDCFTIQILHSIGFSVFDQIIWNKAASSGGSCAWGSWQSATNPSLRDVHEYIILASKNGEIKKFSVPFDSFKNLPLKIDNRKIHLDINEFSSNLWIFNSESAKRVNHPAPFPVELPYRIILMFSKKNDLVLDPFMGSGSVAIASLTAGRNYVGYEINQEYNKIANERIKCFQNNTKFKTKKGEM